MSAAPGRPKQAREGGGTPVSDGDLVISRLDAGYHHRPVISGVTVPAIAAGSVVALVGPNAAGKSTLLKAIAGLVPAQGQVGLAGTDLATLSTRERLRRVGYLPQALPQPTSLLAYEIWQSALRAGRPEWSGAQREAAIAHAVQDLGLGDLALRRMDELSGGQRQMVGLAQAVLRAPQLLLLDEPTSALDLRWQLTVLSTLRRHADATRTLCIVAMHDLNLAARFCHRMLVLHHGRLQAAGAPGDILTPGLLRQVYGVQARVERCSQGQLMVLADTATPPTHPTTEP